jgi:hypothetical protein
MGPTAARTAETVLIAKLERELAELRDELTRAELVITLSQKLAALLDHPARESSTAPSARIRCVPCRASWRGRPILCGPGMSPNAKAR